MNVKNELNYIIKMASGYYVLEMQPWIAERAQCTVFVCLRPKNRLYIPTAINPLKTIK